MKTHTHSATAAAMAICMVASTLAQTSYSTSSHQSTPTNAKSISSDAATPSTSSTPLKWADKHFVTKVAESTQLEIAMAQLATERATNPDVRDFAQKLVTDHEQLSRKLDQLADRKGLRDELAEYTPSTLRAEGMTGHARTASDTAITPASPATSRTTTTPSTTRSTAGTSSVPPAIDSGSYASGEFAGTPVTSTTTTTDWNDPVKDRHYRKLAKKQGADFDKEFIAMMVDDHEEDLAMFDKKAKNASDSDVRAFAEECLPTLEDHLKQAQQIAATQKS